MGPMASTCVVKSQHGSKLLPVKDNCQAATDRQTDRRDWLVVGRETPNSRQVNSDTGRLGLTVHCSF